MTEEVEVTEEVEETEATEEVEGEYKIEVEYDTEDAETTEEVVKEKKNVGKILLQTIGAIVATVLVIYLGMSAAFTQYFVYGTVIDGKDYSFQQVADVEEYQVTVVEGYELVLTTIDGTEEVITSSDVGLQYIAQSQVTEILEAQNPFEWPLMFFETNEHTTTIMVEYDEEALEETFYSLECMDTSNMVASTDAYIEFQEEEYVIVPYELGTTIEETILKDAIATSLLSLTGNLSLEEVECYTLPDITEESQELNDMADELNTYLHGTITYEEGDEVDEEVLSTWIIIGENNEISFDEEKITAFVAELAEKYNTVGTTRTFTAADGATAEVSGGNFGWTVDEATEVEQIILDIEGGVAVEREISYSKRGISHGDVDWGTSYTEIDLTDQKVYYILDGEVVVEGSIVTGDVDGGNATPQGTYSLTYKTTNAVLRGTQYADGSYAYESPVSYWMPFNNGIGMHDASWRSEFGGDIYKTSGSHGCVNMSYSTAQAIYSYISAGDPVICHY